MAGRHARTAPVGISRALATLVASALLLAVGVAAMTILTGRERPATGGPESGMPTVVAAPSTDPTTDPDPATGATPDAGPTVASTSEAEPVESSGAVSFVGEGIGSPTGAGREETAPFRSSPAVPSVPSVPSSPISPSAGGVPPSPPEATPDAATSAKGWVQRSDAGRAHGKAVGLIGRSPDGHGCRPVPTKARPVAQAEPFACR